MSARQPTIRTRGEHSISRRDIDPDALKVLYRLARRGHIAYLVGGGVRDLLLGRQPKDFDVGTDARPRQIKALFRNCFLIGRRFRLAHIKYGKHIIETSTFRRAPEVDGDPNDPETSLLQTEDNTFGTPEEDARRRDFTINGLFYDIESFSVIDYVDGLEDLEAGLIRCIGDPDIRFREDPVRMVRAVRFAARLGFQIEPRTYAAILRHKDELAHAAPARMLEEIYRLFPYGASERAFRLLRQTGLLTQMFPEIDAYLDTAGDDQALLWAHLSALDDGVLLLLPEPTPALRFATLFCDLVRTHAAHANRRHSTHADLVRELLKPLPSRYPVPRRVQDRLRRILTGQQRFNASRRRRFSKARFVSQAGFPETLALLDLHLRATGENRAVVQEWLTYHEGHAKPASDENRSNESDESTAAARRAPRGGSKRRRSRRRKDKSASSRSTTQDASAGDEANATEGAPKRAQRRRSGSPRPSSSSPEKHSHTPAPRQPDISKPLSPADFYLSSSDAKDRSTGT